MSLQTQIWIKDIQEKLNSANQFSQFAKDHTVYVNNNTVHIPNAAAPSTVTRNNSTLPLVPTTRTDVDLTYVLDKFNTASKYVEDLEAVELSYGLRQSIFGQDMNELNDVINDWMIYDWSYYAASGASMVETSAVTFADLLSLAQKFDADNISRRGRKLLVTPAIAKAIYSIDRLEKTNDVNNMISIDGYMGRMAGFDIFVRDTVVEATGTTGAYTIIAPDTATGVTGKDCAIAWHAEYVARAMGTISPFVNEKDALYQGTLLSFAVRSKGSCMRSDGKGVYGLVLTA
jgi:hypothetical protein